MGGGDINEPHIFFFVALAGHQPQDEARPDPAYVLYRAYQQARAELDSSRAEALKFIKPQKNSKGVWHLGFSDDKIDEVSSLAIRISEGEQKIESIAHDSEKFISIARGFQLMPIVEERSQARDAITRVSQTAQAKRRAATYRNPKATLEELAVTPEVVEAEANLTRIKAEMGGTDRKA